MISSATMKCLVLTVFLLVCICVTSAEESKETHELLEKSINAFNQPPKQNNRVIREKAKRKNRKRKSTGKGKKSKRGKSRKSKKGKSRSFRKGKKSTSRKTSSKKGNNKDRKGNRSNQRKSSSERGNNENKKFTSLKKSKVRGLVSSGRKVLKGSHCEYIDLCEIDRMAASGCNSGQKFVIKGNKGVRRQFLMVDNKKIVAFLGRKKKIVDCAANLTDVTSRVSCKTIDGAGDIKLVKQNSTNTTPAAPTPAPSPAPAPAPAPAPSPSPAPAPAPAPSPAPEPAPVTDVMPPLQQGQIHCPCPQRTCFTTITSTNNKHTVTCGSNTYTVPCGGPLMGSKIGLIISVIDVFEQPLCSTNTYTTLIKDLVWQCKNLNIPDSALCPGETPPPEEGEKPINMSGEKPMKMT